jgi:ABC-type transporter Mla subunit MlaD
MKRGAPGSGFWLGLVVWLASALWAAFCLAYAVHQIGLSGLLSLAPQEIGEFLAGIVSLPVFLWVVAGHWQRLEAIKSSTARLQEKLDILLDPVASKNSNHLMASLQAQTDSLKAVSQNAIDTLRGIRGLLHKEVEALTEVSKTSAAQYETINQSLGQRTTALDTVSGKAEATNNLVAATLTSLELSAGRVEQLGGTMESRIAALNGLGNTIVEKLDKSGASIESNLKQLSDVAERLADQQKMLKETGSGMEGDFRAVSDKVAESAGLIQGWLQQWASTGQQISVETKGFEDIIRQRTASLSGTSDALGRITGEAAATIDRLAESGEKFAQSRLDFDAGLKSVGQRLDEAAGKLDGQIGVIDTAERRLSAHLHTMQSTFSQARAEHEGIAQTMQVLNDRTGGVLERLESLRAASTNGVEEIVFHAERLHRQATALDGDLRRNVDTVTEALSQMGQVNQAVEHAAGHVETHAQRAQEALTRTREGLEQASHDIGVQGNIVAARSSDTIATLSEASGRITSIAATSLAQLQETAFGLERVNQDLAGSAEKTEQRVAGAANALKASATEIEMAANHVDNAALGARHATDALLANSGILRATIGEASGAAKEAATALGDAIAGITGAAQQGHHQLSALTEQMRIENDMIFRTINRVAEIDGALRNSGAFVNEIAERARQTIEEVQAGVEKVGQEINVQTVTASEKFAVTNEVLNRTRDELDRVVDKVDSTFGTLNRKAGEINFVVATSVNRLGEMSKSIENAKATIEGTTASITSQLIDTAAVMRTEFVGVQDAASDAADKMERTITRIEAGAAKAGAANQQAEVQLTEALRLVERRGETFAAAVANATTSLGHADRAFTEKQREIALLIEETGGRFDRLSKDMAQQSAMLGSVAGAAAEKLSKASADIEGRMVAVTETVEGAKGVLQTFSAEAESVAERTLEASREVAAQEQALRDNIVKLGTVADDVGEDLQQVANTISETAMNLSETAGHAKGAIQAVSDELTQQGRTILAAESESRALMEKVAELIGEKAMALATAVRDTASHTATFREVDAKARRDLFLNSAKAVLDGLSSLSVDLTRVLDQDIPEKVWKGLNRGDVSSFPRRLAAMRDQIPVSEVRTKFISDGAFRLSVQNYLAQFEQLLEQAMEIGQGDILSSTLMSSDVGKIYYFLSAAVGRERGLQKAS